MSHPAHNAILVFHLAGLVSHCFCEPAFAEAFLADPENRGCVAFFYDDGASAETILSVSPNARARVDAAKNQLTRDLRIKSALDRHGVIATDEIRQSLHYSFGELSYQRVLAGLNRNQVTAPLSETSSRMDMNSAMSMSQILDRFGVPVDTGLRQSAISAFQELMTG